MSRQATNKLLELLEEGVLNKDTVIIACVSYMSESDVTDMCRANEFFDDNNEEEEEEEEL
jgi:hypothetical protein